MKLACSSNNAYDVFQPLMKRFGAAGPSRDFYWAVNHALHAAQARIYDDHYQDMYHEEEMVWQTLFSHLEESKAKLTGLDVGCGTGLVCHFAARFCPERIATFHLLDPSAEMLHTAHCRSINWPFPVELFAGEIFTLPNKARYDVITINSVLHHIVELSPFLETLQRLLRPGGFLLTAQDPGCVLQTAEDDVLRQRRRSAAFNRNQKTWKKTFRRYLTRPLARLLSLRRDDPVTAAANRTLLEQGIITRPMDEKSLFSVTDIHVPDQPLNLGRGIDLADLQRLLPGLRLIADYSYHYHDLGWSRLTPNEIENEKHWWLQNDPHGTLFATAWQKTT